jgi:hypothetical protein
MFRREVIRLLAYTRKNEPNAVETQRVYQLVYDHYFGGEEEDRRFVREGLESFPDRGIMFDKINLLGSLLARMIPREDPFAREVQLNELKRLLVAVGTSSAEAERRVQKLKKKIMR